MKKSLFVLLLCGCVMGVSACQNQEVEKDLTSEALVYEGTNTESNSNNLDQDSITDAPDSTKSVDDNRIIKDQSFSVELHHWGEVKFVSYMPQKDFQDVSFFLEKDGAIVYDFPNYYENNNTENEIGLFDSVAAVGFRDINHDDLKDVIVIINYVTGAGPQGMLPRPTARIFLACEDGFCLATDLMDEIADKSMGGDMSIKSIYEYVEQPAHEISSIELSYEEMLEKFYEQVYSGLTNEEIEEKVMKRTSYYNSSGYYESATKYWENVREVNDITNRIEPLFFTDMKYYDDADFMELPAEIIRLAKNEIYARHGYTFKNDDLNNYFMGCAWYQPMDGKEQLSDLVFNDYEKSNLELLKRLDR